MSESDILLSICISGRNDNYGFAFKRRLVQAINFTAWSAEQIGMLDRMEIVFCDWNSDRPIFEDIKLIAPAAKITRFIEVPPEIASSHNFRKTPFHSDISCNVAFRRARGEFVGMMPADNFLTRFSLRALFALLDGEYGAKELPFDIHRSVLSIPRKNFHSFCREKFFFTSPEEMERRICHADPALNADYHIGLMSGYGLFLVHRELMAKLRGFNENNGGWGLSDVDLGERAVLFNAPTVNLAPYGVCCYDFIADIMMVRQKNSRAESADYHYPEVGEVNPPNWGLGDLELTEGRAEVTPCFIWGATDQDTGTDLADDEILWRLRDSSLHECPRISRFAVDLARRAWRESPRKVVFWGVDPGCALMIAAASPFTDIIVAEGKGDQMLPFYQVDGLLKHFNYHGQLSFVPVSKIHEFMQDADWHIVLDEDVDEAVFAGISPGAALIRRPEKNKSGGFPGNIFSHLVDQRDLNKLWSIFGRLPLFRWPGMLRKIYPRVRICRNFFGKRL